MSDKLLFIFCRLGLAALSDSLVFTQIHFQRIKAIGQISLFIP